MTTYEGEQTAAFNTWFAGIKGKLNEDNLPEVCKIRLPK